MLDFIDSVEVWVSSHQSLMTVIVAPLLVLFVTKLVNRSSERLAEKSQKIERQLSVQMKLAEFRQEWINALRDHISEILSISDNVEVRPGIPGLAEKTHAIILRLNLTEPTSHKLAVALVDLVEAVSSENCEARPEVRQVVIELSRKILKTEWDRLKADLNDAQVDPRPIV